MRQYKGFYIDGVYFHNTEEIDQRIKRDDINRYWNLLRMFERHPIHEVSVACSDQANLLHRNHGMSCEEIESIENAAEPVQAPTA